MDSFSTNNPGHGVSPTSMKKYTCYFFDQGHCKFSADQCLYSHHYDTVRVAEGPTQTQPGCPSVAGTNATRVQPTYTAWREARAHVTTDPVIRKQLDHVFNNAQSVLNCTSKPSFEHAVFGLGKDKNVTSYGSISEVIGYPSVNYNQYGHENVLYNRSHNCQTAVNGADSYHTLPACNGARSNRSEAGPSLHVNHDVAMHIRTKQHPQSGFEHDCFNSTSSYGLASVDSRHSLEYRGFIGDNATPSKASQASGHGTDSEINSTYHRGQGNSITSHAHAGTSFDRRLYTSLDCRSYEDFPATLQKCSQTTGYEGNGDITWAYSHRSHSFGQYTHPSSGLKACPTLPSSSYHLPDQDNCVLYNAGYREAHDFARTSHGCPAECHDIEYCISYCKIKDHVMRDLVRNVDTIILDLRYQNQRYSAEVNNILRITNELMERPSTPVSPNAESPPYGRPPNATELLLRSAEKIVATINMANTVIDDLETAKTKAVQCLEGIAFRKLIPR